VAGPDDRLNEAFQRLAHGAMDCFLALSRLLAMTALIQFDRNPR